MTEQQVFFTRQNNTCFFKLCGELRYSNASGLDELIEQLFEQQQLGCQQVVVDLNQATFLDSTHVGLLASLARHCQQHNLPKPTLFSTVPAVNELLTDLKLDLVFTIVQQDTRNTPALNPVSAREKTDLEQGRMILRAHEALVELNDANRAAFLPVVELLRTQLEPAAFKK